jgi:uncharacterized membrane protein
VIAVVLLAATAAAVAPRATVDDAGPVSFSQVRDIIAARCSNCHSATPAHPAFPAAPLGVVFDTDAQIRAAADRIYLQTVVTRVMPIGNLTAMTDAERQVIEQWHQSLQSRQ